MDLRNEFMPLLRFGQTKLSSFYSVMQRKIEECSNSMRANK